MKSLQPVLSICLLTLFLCHLTGVAEPQPNSLSSSGFADTLGGSNGKIIRVTNLDSKGPTPWAP